MGRATPHEMGGNVGRRPARLLEGAALKLLSLGLRQLLALGIRRRVVDADIAVRRRAAAAA
jgi:hypothetical protein